MTRKRSTSKFLQGQRKLLNQIDYYLNWQSNNNVIWVKLACRGRTQRLCDPQRTMLGLHLHEQAICRYLHGLPLRRLDNAPLSHACPNVTWPTHLTIRGDNVLWDLFPLCRFHRCRGHALHLLYMGWFEMYVTPPCRLWGPSRTAQSWAVERR